METDEYEARPDRQPYRLRPTLLADLVIPSGSRYSIRRGFVTSTVLTAGNTALLLFFGLSAAGIFAVFMTAVTLASPLNDLLTDNREAIYERGENPWTVNLRSALGFLAIFLGMGIAFTAVAIWLGEVAIDRGFGIFLAQVQDHHTLFTQRFGPWPDFLGRNLQVLSAVVVLGFAFRSLGTLMVLGWNAARWASVLFLLTSRAVDESQISGVAFTLAVSAALLPHIMVEALAYIVAALGAIFASRAIVRYGPAHERFGVVLRAAGAMVVVAVVLLVVAALVEDLWAGQIIAALSQY